MGSAGPWAAGRTPSAARAVAVLIRADWLSWKRLNALATNGALSIDLAARIRAGVQEAARACCLVASAPNFARPASRAAADSAGVEETLPAESCAAWARGVA